MRGDSMGSRALALAIGLALATGIVRAAETPPLPQGGLSAALGDAAASGRDARRRAAEAVPLERMPEPHRRLAAQSLRGATLFHHLPTEVVTCDPALLEFVLEKPEVMVDLWRTLGISRLALDPVAPGQWRFADGYGTEGAVRLLHRERTAGGGLLVFHGRGGYTGPLAARPLTGSCLVLMRHRAVEPDSLGRPRLAVQVDAFLDVDGLGLEIVTRTLQPLIVRSAAGNFHEICLFVSQFAAAAERNPAGVERLAGRMSRTAPQDRRALARLASGANHQGSAAATAEEMQAELAARWLPADQLAPPRR
jgi:hypothetical protein